MNRKAILIVGLPGSGKTHYGEHLWDHCGFFRDEDAMWIDDPYPDRVNELEWALASTIETILITDPTACDTTFPQIASRFDKHNRAYTIVCYENDPEACWANLERRGDNKMSKAALFELSKRYDPTKLNPDFTLGVYKP